MIKTSNKNHISIEMSFLLCCGDGNLNKAKKLIQENPTVNIIAYADQAFRYACRKGCLEVAQWLYSLQNINISTYKNEYYLKKINFLWNTPTIDISANNEEIFRVACECGHLEVAQWLLSIKPTIDISAKNDYAFRFACENGDLHIAQWLLSIKPSIDISIYDESIFRYTCEKGHLNVVQWLLSIKPTIDISTYNDDAFKNACRKGHLNVAQWLQSLLPDKYEFTIENNKIIGYNIKPILPISNNIVSLSYNSKEELVCPICYDETKFIEIQTNCKHNFCKSCIIDYYNHSITKYGSCDCPYCRQDVTSLSNLELQNATISLN